MQRYTTDVGSCDRSILQSRLCFWVWSLEGKCNDPAIEFTTLWTREIWRSLDLKEVKAESPAIEIEFKSIWERLEGTS